jgi:FkbM family methyltransferase
MSMIESIKRYYSLFGLRGLLFVIKSRLLKRRTQVKLSLDGLKHPLYLRLRTSDVYLLSSILLNLEYELGAVPRPKTIVDAGANIGLTSVFYANKYPEAKIIAVEPDCSNFEMLKRNTEHYTNILPIQAALWKEDAQLVLSDPGLDHESFRTQADEGASSLQVRARVNGLTIDTLMKDLSLSVIDLLKVDIEGSEKELFAHSSSWVNKVGIIAVEFHDRFKPGCSDAVHAATRNFEFKWTRGDTSFFAREAYANQRASKRESVLMDSCQPSINAVRYNLPLKIEWEG